MPDTYETETKRLRRQQRFYLGYAAVLVLIGAVNAATGDVSTALMFGYPIGVALLLVVALALGLRSRR